MTKSIIELADAYAETTALFPTRDNVTFQAECAKSRATLIEAINNIKAAHLAELAGVEMPEPVATVTTDTGVTAIKFTSPSYKKGDTLVTSNQCREYAAGQVLKAVAAERERILNCYSPDDTITDYQDKIRGNK